MRLRLSPALMLIALLAVLLMLASCGPGRQQGRATETKQPEHGLEEKMPSLKPLPQIGPLRLEPYGEEDPHGILLIAGRVKISVEAPGARRVEFYTASPSEEGPGIRFWSDDSPEDGWAASWEPPLPGEPFRLTAIAYFDRETAASSAVVLWPADRSKTPSAEGSLPVPFTLLDPRSRIDMLEGLPKYFRAAGWIDQKTIFGLSGTTPFLVNLETGRATPLDITAWEAKLSPDGKQFSYLQEGGIYLAEIDGRGSRHVWPAQPPDLAEANGFPAGGLWSPRGDKLLVWRDHEWDGEFFIIKLQRNGQAYKLETFIEGYFLTSAVGWADEQRLVFTTRANAKKDGIREYSFGYRSNLAVYDLETNTYRLVSDTADGEFLEGLSSGPGGIFFLRWFETGDRIAYGIMELGGKIIWEFPFYRFANLFLAPDNISVACLAETGQAEMNAVYKLALLAAGKELPIAELQIADHSLSQIYWCPAGKKLLLSFYTIVPVAEQRGSYAYRYYTLIIEPQMHR